jgi:hypothetical protein
VFVILLPLVLAAQLFAGISQKQADAAAALQTRPQSPQTDSKHPSTTKAIKYVNKKYGFTFSLPGNVEGILGSRGYLGFRRCRPSPRPFYYLDQSSIDIGKGVSGHYIMCSATLNGNRFSGEISLSARHPWSQGNLGAAVNRYSPSRRE